MNDRQLLMNLRALGDVRAPEAVLDSVLDEVDLGTSTPTLDTPLGPVFVAWNRLGVSAVMKTTTDEEFEARFRDRFRRAPRPGRQVPDDPGAGFDLRSVTEFERAVLLKALRDSAGRGAHVRLDCRRRSVTRRAVRAVGSALRKNPVPVLIPCHRVVRSDGHIGQYALGGSANKRAILAAEGVAL